MSQPHPPTESSSTMNGNEDSHYSVASFDISSLGHLEDMLSIASHEAPASPAATPPSNKINNSYVPLNAVHMEVQENAKLPTFNLPVDRTNSSHSRILKLAPDTKHDLDEIIRLSEKDVNLTEMFLHSSDRSSMNMNWNSAGALLSHIGDHVDMDEHSSAAMSGGSKGASNATLHFVQNPPVPRSVHFPSVPQLAPTAVGSPMNPAQDGAPFAPSESLALGKQHPTTHSAKTHFPYHRTSPLPIPKRLSPETTSEAVEGDGMIESNKQPKVDDAMTAALVTAAAIASHRQTALTTEAGKTALHAPPTTAARHDRNPQMKQPYAEKVGYRSAGIPSASILEATKQRSQFGFGGDHVVPSVPGPQPQQKQQQRRKPPTPIARPPVATSTNNIENAYERKKQRAKEARVKLNDAIERTAIAISLSGTQSRQRAAQLNAIRVTSTGLRDNTLHALQECSRIAGEAKKWDRPSFVGTAASLIQALNGQCEALMSEILEMKRPENEVPDALSVDEAVWKSASNTSSRVSPSFNGDANTLCHETGTAEIPQSTKRKNVAGMGGRDLCLHAGVKRPRLGEPSTGSKGASESCSFVLSPSTIDSMLSSTPAMQCIMAMLDPRSLVRCSKVSKSWNFVFQNGIVWLDRSIERFGHYNVRQWKERMKDEHLPPCSSLTLYRNMDSANVKPYCKHEGSLFLGEARMPGKVSAWVSMVERSNGETIRSVVKESDPRSYMSLPVVELRLLIQNTGSSDFSIILREQTITVDASTRRRGEELEEIRWDSRFHKTLLNLDGSVRAPVDQINSHDVVKEICRLKLFEAAVLVVHVHARGCQTTSKFQQKSNFTKVLVTLNGTTVPLVVPFFRDSGIT